MNIKFRNIKMSLISEASSN